MASGPIPKDWLYYGFWFAALIVACFTAGRVLYLLTAILHTLRALLALLGAR